MIMETMLAKIAALWPIAVGCMFAAVFIGSMQSDLHNQQTEINQVIVTQQSQMTIIQNQLSQIQIEIQGLHK